MIRHSDRHWRLILLVGSLISEEDINARCMWIHMCITIDTNKCIIYIYMGLVGIPSSTFTHLHHLHLIIFGKCIGEGISTIEIPSPVPKRYTSEGKH